MQLYCSSYPRLAITKDKTTFGPKSSSSMYSTSDKFSIIAICYNYGFAPGANSPQKKRRHTEANFLFLAVPSIDKQSGLQANASGGLTAN